MSTRIDPAAQAYIDAIPAEHRPLFDRVHRLVVEAYPEVAVVVSYKMPTYVVGVHRLHVAVWTHGVSIYGDDRSGFTERHPELTSGKGTIRLTPKAAQDIDDDELRALVRAALSDDA
ncbi:MAG: DUF1801 domain-containing protein [Acidimicrobiales bacterium]